MPQSADQFSGIFICYRRDDSAGHAGRLYDRLAAHFGEEQIFMDLDQIEPGEDFVQVIEKAVGSCKVLLAVIGRSWLTSSDGAGHRIDNSNDYVRLEITSALARNIHLIPVLVQGAQMPRPEDLSQDLRPLLRRNAVELSDLRWKRDVSQLVDALEKIIARPLEPQRAATLASRSTAGGTSGVPSSEATRTRSKPLGATRKRVELAQTISVIFLMFVAAGAAIALRYVTDEPKREASVAKPTQNSQAPTGQVATEQQPTQDVPTTQVEQGTPKPTITPAPALSTPTPFLLRVRVRADSTANGWTDSGLMVRKGQKLRISATGRVSLGEGRFSTPTGLPRVVDTEKLMRNEPTGELIAVIGDDNDEFIPVGANREFYAPRDGRFFLGVNEGSLKDNTGTYEVTIEIVPM